MDKPYAVKLALLDRGNNKAFHSYMERAPNKEKAIQRAKRKAADEGYSVRDVVSAEVYGRGGGAANMVASMPYYAARGGGGAAAKKTKQPKRPKTKTVLLVIREWHRRSYGGMFATVEIYVNGAFVTKLGPSGGGSSMAEQNATKWLVENGYAKDKRGNTWAFWRLAEDNKFKGERTVTEVPREKDL